MYSKKKRWLSSYCFFDFTSGLVTRGFAQRNAMNVCRFLMDSTAMERFPAMDAEGVKAMLGGFEKGEVIFESTDIAIDYPVVYNCKKEGANQISVKYPEGVISIAKIRIFEVL